MFEKRFKLKIEHGGQMLRSSERMISKLNSKVMRGEEHSTEWGIWRHRNTRWAIKAFPGIIKYFKGNRRGVTGIFFKLTRIGRIQQGQQVTEKNVIEHCHCILTKDNKKDYMTKKKPTPCSTL